MPMVLRSRKSIYSSQASEAELLEATPAAGRRSTRLHGRVTYEVGILLLSFSASSSSAAENFGSSLGHVAAR